MFNSIFLQIQVTQSLTGAASQTASKVPPLSVFDLTIKGGIMMIPLFILLLLAVYIFIERFLVLNKAAREDENFMNRIRDYIHDGKIEAATALCQSTQNPIARMIEKGINRLGRPLNDITAAIENVGNLEISKLEKGLPTLATCAGGAPMIGFLGTVVGMVQAFYNMSAAGNNIDITLLSGGIYVAMITTVGGLIVGILAYFAHNYLTARIDNLVHRMESRTTEFMDLLNEPIN